MNMDRVDDVSASQERLARALKRASIGLLVAGMVPVLSFLVYMGLMILGRIQLQVLAPTDWLVCVLLVVLSRDVLRGENLGLAIGVVAFYATGAAVVTVALATMDQSLLPLMPGAQLLLSLVVLWLLFRARRESRRQAACRKAQTR
jgi:hypothetical protein